MQLCSFVGPTHGEPNMLILGFATSETHIDIELPILGIEATVIHFLHDKIQGSFTTAEKDV